MSLIKTMIALLAMMAVLMCPVGRACLAEEAIEAQNVIEVTDDTESVDALEGIIVQEMVREPLEIDLTGTDPVVMPAGVIATLAGVAKSPVSAAIDSLDLDLNGTPDFLLEVQKDGTYLVKRQPCADDLACDYTYEPTDGPYSSITLKVNVYVPVASVSLNKTEISLRKGKTATLVATITPANATNQTLKWCSTDSTVIKVRDNGEVMAMSPGTAIITASAEDGKVGASCVVNVVKMPINIVAKKKTFKKKTKVKKYTCTLKSGSKLLNKANLTLKVKGKTYKAVTNKKGKAVFKIRNLKKKGKYTATIKYAGNRTYKGTSKKVKIKVK